MIDVPLIDTAPSITLVIAIGAFVISGIYLMLERSLTRVLIGFILLGNAVNLLFLVASGRAGNPAMIGSGDEADMSDPLPQAMVLTAIVITLGISAFILAMAYRSWQLHGHDEVQDDLEDRRIARFAAKNAPTVHDEDTDSADNQSLDDQAADVRDETDDTPVDPVVKGRDE